VKCGVIYSNQLIASAPKPATIPAAITEAKPTEDAEDALVDDAGAGADDDVDPLTS
jgi:hypothetical protein